LIWNYPNIAELTTYLSEEISTKRKAHSEDGAEGSADATLEPEVIAIGLDIESEKTTNLSDDEILNLLMDEVNE